MKKLGTLIFAILLLNALMIAGLAGFVVATGRLDGPKAKTLLDMVKHKGTPEGLREKVADIMDPMAATTATAPATQENTGVVALESASPSSAAASASDRIEYARQAMEQERLQLDREAQDLLQRQKLLESQRIAVEAKLAQITEQKKTFEAMTKTTQTDNQKENFAKTLALYSDMKPKQVKEMFLNLSPALVADYLQAMDSDQTAKIIAEFKTAEERAFMGRVIERIRTVGTNSALGTGGAAPAIGTEGAQARN